MYPMLNLQQLMSMYRQQPLQYQQPPQQNTQQGGGSGGGGMNLSSMKNMYNQFAGGEGGGWGGMFGGGTPAAGAEAAPIGGVGSYAGAYPLAADGAAGAGAAEGLGAAGAAGAEGLGAAGAGAAEGIGAAGAGIGEGFGALLALMFSDPKVKENKARVGELYDGTPVWSYNYIGDHVPRIGLMANEVRPDAVYDIGGVKAVNYHTATEGARAIGGILGNLGA